LDRETIYVLVAEADEEYINRICASTGVTQAEELSYKLARLRVDTGKMKKDEAAEKVAVRK
jgi:hypothetical protein